MDCSDEGRALHDLATRGSRSRRRLSHKRRDHRRQAAHAWSIYVRLKVLTEKGKEYANVELKYASGNNGGGYTVSDIQGRTIHPDGTIIPFTGKPYEKLIEKTQGYEGFKYMAKVFTLPDVEVGSIIEYRYSLRYDDNYFMSPDWFIQSELFLRKGHYLWKPTGEQLLHRSSGGREQVTNSIGWFPVLPAGTAGEADAPACYRYAGRPAPHRAQRA